MNEVRHIFLWLILLAAIYMNAAQVYVLHTTGFNWWKFWWSCRANTQKTERRFEEELKKVPRVNVGYQIAKWSIGLACFAYLAAVVAMLMNE